MSNDVAVKTDAERALAGVTEAQGFYTSLSLSSPADKFRMLNIINNSEPLLEQVGKQIAIKDVVMMTVDVTDQQTGEVGGAVRIVLVTPDNVAYHATSKGIVQSLRQLFNLFGEPTTWKNPVKANVLEKKGRGGFRFLTLDFVE